MEKVLDNVVTVQLPEGVSIEMIPAGIAVRATAYLIDFLIRSVIMIIGITVFALLGTSGTGLILVLFFLVSWLYYILFEMRDGQTPGKKRLGIQVVEDSGLPAGFSAVVLRNLLRAADALPFTYFLGLISMTFNRDFKRLGDWAAGTRVVYQRQNNKLAVDSADKPYQLRLPVTTDEQKNILRFSERAQQLSEARQMELANHLDSVLQVRDSAAVKRLHQMARYYSG